MTGLQEILLLLIVLIVVVLASRHSAARQVASANPVISFRHLKLPARRRLALVLSVFWPLGVAAWLHSWQNPWQNEDIWLFACLGLAPVALAWSIWWIWCGFKK